MLGAPPAFVLSQDQTLYKWYLSLKSVKSCSLSTQSLASCVNYFWNCFKCFSKHIKVPYKFFDIVQFSRSCAPQPCGWRPVYFTTEVVFCQALFFRSFWTFWTWTLKKFLRTNWNFSASIGSFQGLPAEASEVILLPQRLALKYNTTPPPPCQHFLTDFFILFCVHPKTAAGRRKSCAAAALVQLGTNAFSLCLYNVL